MKTHGNGCEPSAECACRLLRGQHRGYRHYEDTVVERLVAKAATNGMEVFRVFDALNDVRKVKPAIPAVIGNRGEIQGAAGTDD